MEQQPYFGSPAGTQPQGAPQQFQPPFVPPPAYVPPPPRYEAQQAPAHGAQIYLPPAQTYLPPPVQTYRPPAQVGRRGNVGRARPRWDNRRLAVIGIIVGALGIVAAVVLLVITLTRSPAAKAQAGTCNGCIAGPAPAPQMASRADVVAIGKSIAAYYVDNNAPLSLQISDGEWLLMDPGGATVDSGALSLNELVASSAITPETWCVALGVGNDPASAWMYNSTTGLQPGVCPSPGTHA